MRKEVVVTHEIVACEVCGRTILKGERTEPYLVPDGSRRQVCELCTRRAEGAGWIRESTHADMPTVPPGGEARPSLLERFRSRWRANGPATRGRAREAAGADGQPTLAGPDAWREPGIDPGAAEPDRYSPSADPGARQTRDGSAATVDFGGAEAPAEPPSAGLVEQWTDPSAPAAGEAAAETGDEPGGSRRRERRYGRLRRDPRAVRAVPTNAEAKVERALELFNASEYSRTVGGLMRTLGEPWVAAFPAPGSSSEVSVVVAWELSWYHYRVDLGEADPVALTDKGKELSELSEDQRRWNAVSDRDGMLALGVPRES